ncbi:hypothetical protein BHM03_00006922 [Ensete ventricosum]|nr:hypothetical protein BHM03_00006922 [Ensete ventricosum]
MQISPSLFHGNVGPTAMSLPSTSSAYINVVATFAAAGVDFCTAFSLHMIGKFLYFLPSVGRVASTASLHCTLPTAVATSSAKSSPSSPASPLLAALQSVSLPKEGLLLEAKNVWDPVGVLRSGLRWPLHSPSTVHNSDDTAAFPPTSATASAVAVQPRPPLPPQSSLSCCRRI